MAFTLPPLPYAPWRPLMPSSFWDRMASIMRGVT